MKVSPPAPRYLVDHRWRILWLAVASSAAVVWWLAIAPSDSTIPTVTQNSGLGSTGSEPGIGTLPPPQNALVESVKNAINRPGFVFHVKWSAEDGSGIEGAAWVDATGGKARMETVRNGDLESLEIIEGTTVSRYAMGGRDSFPGNSSGHIVEPHLKALPYLRDLAYASGSSSGATTFNSEPVILLTAEALVPSEDGSAVCTATVKTYLTSVTLLPIRSEGSRACPAEAPTNTGVVGYTGANFVPGASIGQDFFSGAAIADIFVGEQLEQARTLGFPIYWLNNGANAGLKLAHVEVIHDSDTPVVRVVYSSSSRSDEGLPDLAVVQRASGTAPDKGCESPATHKTLLVRGLEAHLCSGTSSAMLLKLDGTTLYLYAMAHLDVNGLETNPFNNEDSLRRAAESLEILD